MTFDEIKAMEKRNVLVGIRFDGYTRELLDWALVKVADPGDQVIAVHVCRNSDSTSDNKSLLDGYLDDYEGICNKKQIDLTGQVLTGRSIKKVLLREAKNRGAVALVLGISKHNGLGGLTSIAKYCAKRLPPTTEVMAIHNGKIVFSRSQLPGTRGDPKPSFYLVGGLSFKDNQSEFGDSEISDIGRCSLSSKYESKDDDFGNIAGHKKACLSSVSSFMGEVSQQRPGWPLLRTASSLTPALEARKMSVVKWVMSLPNRSLLESPQSREGEYEELPENLELHLETNISGIKWFSHDVLKTWTSQFSADNLIGKGGCNSVYKGILPDGKPVAIKILKSSKEALKDFTLEVDIMTSLKHKSITPLLGICINDNNLISVYDFLSKGNLEENLHGHNMEKSVLPWEVRFNVALKIAEALNYLHNECSRPVIHRDVKSSNILLSDEIEPQLSDFGLAVWGPQNSSFLTHSDVVGTFGYLAPEYFMYGKVSDKIDVYSFGVVLLELLSGRKPIGCETPSGQESLVMWAKPKLETGDLSSILDSNLDRNVDEAQMQRMALAATLCLTRSARLRPKMSKILKILRGEKEVDETPKAQFGDCNDSENQDNNDDDEVYPDSNAESHLDTALLDVEDYSPTSFSSGEHNRISLEDYLKGRWSRSSSLD